MQQRQAKSPETFVLWQDSKLGRNGYPTYGALLCFGKYPQHWLPGARTYCIRWEGNEQDNFLDRIDLDSDLLFQYNNIIEFLRKHLYLIRDRAHEGESDQWEIPFVVLREAVANALIHRDYPRREDGTYIEIFDNRIEITNPGRFPEGTIAETFIAAGSQGRYTNPLIAEIFYLCGHVEQVGSGMRKMIKEMEIAKLQPPEFAEVKQTRKFKVVLHRPKQLNPSHSIEISSARPFLSSVPPMPSLIIGRDSDLAQLKQRIGITSPGQQVESIHVLTAMRGWPGVGKTTLAAALAHDPEISSRFPDGVLWASLGQQPNLYGELSNWGRALGPWALT